LHPAGGFATKDIDIFCKNISHVFVVNKNRAKNIGPEEQENS
jgi:hypothetical protein